MDVPASASRVRIDLHAHTSASFDGVAAPEALVLRALERGLTHVVITDHDTIDGARRAVESAPTGLTVIVGSEVLTTEGDLVFAFLQRALPKGLNARDAIAAGREQGALVGLPHPFDRSRRSVLRDPENLPLAEMVDWVEVWNARVATIAANDEAAGLARRFSKPAVAVSDAHTLLEMGGAFTGLDGPVGDAQGLLAALRRETVLSGPSSGARDEPPGRRGWFRRARSGAVK